jgi:hypothetical protein
MNKKGGKRQPEAIPLGWLSPVARQIANSAVCLAAEPLALASSAYYHHQL